MEEMNTMEAFLFSFSAILDQSRYQSLWPWLSNTHTGHLWWNQFLVHYVHLCGQQSKDKDATGEMKMRSAYIFISLSITVHQFTLTIFFSHASTF